jgi:hypothetical protein
VRVSISILSPVVTNSGTGTSNPLASFAGFVTFPDVVALDGRLGVRDFANDRCRQFDGNGLALVERQLAREAVSR